MHKEAQNVTSIDGQVHVFNLVVSAGRDGKWRQVQLRTERIVSAAAKPSSPPAGTYVRIRVKVCRHGMTPEVLLRVFDPFFTTEGEKGAVLSHVVDYEHRESEQLRPLVPSVQPDETIAAYEL